MRRLLLAIPLLLGVLLLLAWSQQRPQPFFVSGMLEADEIRVGSRIGGRIREVNVREGHQVKAGDILLTIDPFDLQERLAEAKAAMTARESAVSRLKAGFRSEEIEQARARRDRAEAVLARAVAGPRPLEIRMLEDKLAFAATELTNAEFEFNRLKLLHELEQAIPREMEDVTRLINSARAKSQLAQDELALANEGTRAEDIAEARASLAEADQALALAVNGYRKEDIAEAEAHLASAQASVRAMERQLEELTIRSPIDCVVEALDLQPGDLMAPNAPVATLLDPRTLWVRAYVPENRLNISLDQKAWVRVDSFPDRSFVGHVSFIARHAEFTPSNIQTPEERIKQVFRIKVMLDEGLDPRAGLEVLRPGMSADVFFAPPGEGDGS